MIDVKYYTKYFNRNFQPIANNSTSWIPSGASTFIDFTQGKIYIKRPYQIDTAYPPFYGDIHSFVRSGSRAAARADGSVQIFPAGVPRITDLGLRVTSGATNLLTYSKDFSVDWIKGQHVISTHGVTAPNGSATASRFVRNGSTNLAVTQSTITGTPRKSIWARSPSGQGSKTIGLLGYFGFAKYQFTITEEWQRFEAQHDDAETGGNSFYAVDFRFGTATQVELWGAKLETGSVATDYIPTTGSSASAGADQYTLTDLAVLGLTPAVLAAGFTVVVDWTPDGVGPANEFPRVISMETAPSSTSDISLNHRHTNGQVKLGVRDNGTFQADIADNLSTLISGGQPCRSAIAIEPNNFRISNNGAAVGADNTGNVPSGLETIFVGKAFSGPPYNGFIRSIAIIPTPVNDATLQSLSGGA